MRNVSLAAAVAALVLASCAKPPYPGAATTSLALHYRARAAGDASDVVATGVYRGLLARSMFSHCEMLPNDSAAFDLTAQSCGPVRATLGAMSRLLLERAAHPRYLEPVLHEGRLLWRDDPMRCQ